MMKQLDRRQIAGWISVSLSMVITCFWAFWGIVENFHEGWPREGGNWHEAQQVCQHLSENGLVLAPTPQNIWRLPTMAEAVACGTQKMHRLSMIPPLTKNLRCGTSIPR